MSKKSSRREFIKASTIGLLATGATISMGRIIAQPPDMKLPNPYPVLPNKELDIKSTNNNTLFFNDHQYAMVAILAAIIIPTDEDPGATEAGVAGYIDKFVTQSPKRQAQYVKGLKYIDEISKQMYEKDFLSLKIKDQITLLRSIDKAESMRKRPASGFLERVDRKIDTLWNDFFGVGNSSHFFYRIRRDVFSAYYSNPISWKVIGYYGPPQPVGYLDYANPPSADNHLSSIRQIDNATCQNCHFDQLHEDNHEDPDDCMNCHQPHFPFWSADKND